jgi:8-oxo-dGTP pyrophosphatase MutT (NUDIX family)
MESAMSVQINTRVTLYQGRVFKLVSENVTFNSGVTTDMDFIRHPGAAAIIPMPNEAEVILIKQYRHALRRFIWEIPAGTLAPRETVIRCARRELIEETGYSAGKWQELGEITPVPGYSNERVHIFLATDLKPAKQNLDEDELLNVYEINFEAALKMIFRGEIQDAKTISGLFMTHNWLNKK